MKLNVAGESRSWANGKVLLFDDSFEHEVKRKAVTFFFVFRLLQGEA